MISENDPRARWSDQRIAIFEADTRALLGDKRVQNLLWYTLALCGIYRTSLSAADAAFIEGERNVGLKLISFLDEFNPEIYPALLILGSRAAAEDEAHKRALNQTEGNDQ